MGAVRYRAGQADKAVEEMNAAIQRIDDPNAELSVSPAYYYFFLAMAHHRLGNAEAALSWFTKATEAAQTELGTHENTSGQTMSWNRRLTLELLNKEAAQLLGVDAQ